MVSNGVGIRHYLFFARWCMAVVMTTGIFACSYIPSLQPSTSFTECPPQSYTANIYRPTALPTFPVAVSSTSIPNIVSTAPFAPVDIHLHFQKLIQEVRRWTAITPFPIGDSSEVWVAITFLSPELLRTVSTTDILSENPAGINLDSQVDNMLTDIAKREKLLFFLTAFKANTGGTASNSHTFQIDVENLNLINAKNLSIKPAYYDHNLGQKMEFPKPGDSSQLAQSLISNYGYLYYPLGVETESGCMEVLESTFNTKIILEAQSIIIDGKSTGPYTWTIDYTYLLNTNTNPIPNATMAINSTIESTDMLPTATEISDRFWEEYSKFIWGKLTPKH